MIKRAAILSTGDELTTGKVIDTNSAFIADRLFSMGIKVAAVLKVGDDREALLWAMREAADLGEIIIGTGGLGPTEDDLTSEVVAEFLGRPLVQNEEIAAALRKRFEARRIPWTANNLKQALFPQGAEILPNPVGTAPGFRVSFGENKTLSWLSGVPQEMTAMFDLAVMPWIVAMRGGQDQIFSQAFKVYGLTESKLDDLVKPIGLEPGIKLSFRAHYPDLTLRVTVAGASEEQRRFIETCKRIRLILGSHIYAEGDTTLEQRVGQLLSERHRTLALAESCTGGLISHRITGIAGSSAYYLGGVTSYANDVKVKLLGVTPATLEKYGAVSQETALEMSHGIRERIGADFGLSVTGIAGPGGGTPEKPVGTVWISIAQAKNHEARLFQFHGDRERIILGTSQAALNWLRLALLE
ncbi:MAG TPA: competence/damage-inducible protein A [Candidatus Eisenbacteria bacterium]|nr:competence/damage-inducible protein A [Candidatus Eisenbacteria bacterium]